MTLLVPIMLFGWVPFTIILFFHLKPHRAVLVSLIGGWLLLPMAGYNLPGLPEYSKSTAIALGLILGGRLSGQRQKADFSWTKYDLPMLFWCLSPLPTSLANQLGWYDGLAGFFGQAMTWGIPYLAGRVYFKDSEALRDLCMGMVIGGLLYVPLCLYEIRMSPQLSNIFYGFFPHSFGQHARYGGWRPIVFMQHGLMVSLWMAATATVAFWLWRGRVVDKIKSMPMGLVVAALVITAVLSKSANGWFFLALGCGSYLICRGGKTNSLLLLLLLLIPFYISLRITGYLNGAEIEAMASHLFDAERVNSLATRLKQEDLFIARAMENPMFGWGGYGRNWPVDPETGKKLIEMIDALWLIALSSKGFFGLVSLFAAMLLGPWRVLKLTGKTANSMDISPLIPMALSLVVIFFMIDSLYNGMLNQVYVVISGALVSWHTGKTAALAEISARSVVACKPSAKTLTNRLRRSSQSERALIKQKSSHEDSLPASCVPVPCSSRPG